MPASEAIKKQRGERVRSIRKTLYMNRKAFAEKHGIPYATLQNWEDGRFGGLSIKGAKTLATIFTAEGIECSAPWLLDAVGEQPKAIAKTLHIIAEPKAVYGAVTKELNLFYEHNPGATHFILTDANMEPRFSKGETVAGVQMNPHQLNKLTNKDCIIQCKTGKTLVRRIAAAEADSISIKALAKEKTNVLNKKEILFIAPVIWARREE